MASRISVFFKKPEYDSAARHLTKEMRQAFPSRKGVSAETARTFLVEGPGDRAFLGEAAALIFADPIIETAELGTWPEKRFDFAVSVGYKPGVTDNTARTAAQALADYAETRKIPGEWNVAYSRLFFLRGFADAGEVKAFITGNVLNELIEQFELISAGDWKAGRRFSDTLQAPHFERGAPYETLPLDIEDPLLTRLSRDRILSLSLEEMKAIQGYFAAAGERREKRAAHGLGPHPTDVELEAISQTWSEHCKHKIFAARAFYRDSHSGEQRTIDGLFKTYIKATTEQIAKTRRDLLSVFTDNAGIVAFDDEYAYALKVETHNSPSALDPYGGAMTGIVGVNRDILGTGLGARPIFNTDVFCFADPSYDGKVPAKLMHPKRIFRGVHRGVKDGGNESGIPTVNGAIVFHPRFLGKPLVFCGTGGLLPRTVRGRDAVEKPVPPGSLIVMVGGRIGKDGIHGATFSSAALTEASPTSAVQIGDPITQKKMTEFLMAARDRGLYIGLTDNGAGGLSSSLGEMAQTSGGCRIDLDRAPLKYPGLKPWEILISEAQERMSLSVDPARWEDLLALARLHEVEASVVGEFTDSGYFHCTFEGKTVCLLELEFLHHGLPRLHLRGVWKRPTLAPPDPKILQVENQLALLKKMLVRPNIASKEHWVRQYDHEVQASTVGKPFTGVDRDGPGDAAVLKPRFDSWQGLVVSCGLAPRYSDIDARAMTLAAVDEAMRNLIAAGGDPATAVGLDNFCWPDPVSGEDNPDAEFKLAQLVRSCEALQEACLAYGLPLISGKDSMKNDYGRGKERISVPPTLLFTAAAKIDDVRRSVTTDLKKAGNAVYLLGLTRSELGGSEFLAERGLLGDRAPDLDAAGLKANLAAYRALHQAMKKGLVASCHDLSDGGLAVAAVEMCFGGMLGFTLELAKVPVEGLPSDTEILYSESLGRLLVEVPPARAKAFEAAMKGTTFAKVGLVAAKPVFTVKGRSTRGLLLEVPVAPLKDAWKGALVF
ncbi:MAG: phosphoribosylformylglycinamidine synthase [Spirochaetes bacterium]|nr:phosphoribosylformylglycinamidine synthase [Spirochaetota bacterium]